MAWCFRRFPAAVVDSEPEPDSAGSTRIETTTTSDHRLLCCVTALIASLFLTNTRNCLALEPARRPNIVLIFADDLGYGDLGCYGAKGYSTPALDQIAAQGIRFTNFYVPAAVCSASRAALLTGCYPQRVSMMGALGPQSKIGIHPDEQLLPERLRESGYATGMFGKWHLGDHPRFSPIRNGFFEYFGLPYSNDMWPLHPTAKTYPPLPLLDGIHTLALNPDQNQLTESYTRRAVQFIEAHRDEPFFLYVAHNMPHVPLFASKAFRGRTQRGLYGDVIEEMDAGVGEILSALERCGLADHTLVVFTSDNGPWLSYGDHAGSAGGLREGKGTTWEGGQRVPCVARLPGTISPGTVCTELATTMDWLPTIMRLATGNRDGNQTDNAVKSNDAQDANNGTGNARPIDGHDISDLLRATPGAKSKYEAFYYYWNYRLEAIRAGKWKLHFPHSYRSLKTPGNGGQPGEYVERTVEQCLFDLERDPGESTDVAAEHRDVVQQLERLAERARAELGDSLQKRVGSAVRPAGSVED